MARDLFKFNQRPLVIGFDSNPMNGAVKSLEENGYLIHTKNNRSFKENNTDGGNN